MKSRYTVHHWVTLNATIMFHANAPLWNLIPQAKCKVTSKITSTVHLVLYDQSAIFFFYFEMKIYGMWLIKSSIQYWVMIGESFLNPHITVSKWWYNNRVRYYPFCIGPKKLPSAINSNYPGWIDKNSLIFALGFHPYFIIPMSQKK